MPGASVGVVLEAEIGQQFASPDVFFPGSLFLAYANRNDLSPEGHFAPFLLIITRPADLARTEETFRLRARF